MNRRLFRSRTDSVIGGVAGGVAEYLDVDPSIVRIIWAILAIVTGGIFVVLYIVMWIVVPEAPLPVIGMGMPPGAGAVPPAEGTAPAEGAAPLEGAGVPGEAAPAAGAPAAGWQRGWSAGYDSSRRRGSGGALVFGLILVALGAWFLIDEYVPGIDTDLLWPVGLVLLGVLLLVVSMRRPVR
jgi:phage shock protein PspC (stress-responsive transcriptional regulator)